MNEQMSPCMHCPRGRSAATCEDKRCPQWRAWFIARWDRLHQYPRLVMERSEPVALGVPLGGSHYAAPHQIHAYLKTDPCVGCECPRNLCHTPCRVRRAWERANREVLS